MSGLHTNLIFQEYANIGAVFWATVHVEVIFTAGSKCIVSTSVIKFVFMCEWIPECILKND